MYYSKQSNVNNDYYNVYDYSDEEKKKENILNTIIKVLAIILLLTFIIFGYIFMLKERQFEQTSVKKITLIPEIITEPSTASMPSSKDSALNSQEILTIVHIVMQQMNQEMAKKEKHLSTTSSIEGDDEYAKALMSQEIDEIKNTMNNTEASSINIEKVVKSDMKLNETNHYNKIIIKKEKKEEIDYLAQLSNKLSSEISQFTEVPKASYYTKSISKELNVRSNEMRVIVVEKGDTLSKIAFKAYGDYDAYPKILLANPEIIVNPDQIFVGQRLRIPA